MGRPTKLNDEVSEFIVSAIRAGNYAEVAAKAAGIHPATYYDWMKRGKAGKEADRLYAEFANAVKKAEGEAEAHAVALVRKAMPDNWQAAMTYLERRYPDRWRRRERHEITGPDGGPIVATPATDQRLHEVARLINDAMKVTRNGHKEPA